MKLTGKRSISTTSHDWVESKTLVAMNLFLFASFALELIINGMSLKAANRGGQSIQVKHRYTKRLFKFCYLLPLPAKKLSKKCESVCIKQLQLSEHQESQSWISSLIYQLGCDFVATCVIELGTIEVTADFSVESRSFSILVQCKNKCSVIYGNCRNLLWLAPEEDKYRFFKNKKNKKKRKEKENAQLSNKELKTSLSDSPRSSGRPSITLHLPLKRNSCRRCCAESRRRA